MKKITEINTVANNVYTHRKLRVAAYCRVSSDSEEQMSSLENQSVHYTDYIKANTDWEFAGLYHDDGISGTKKDKRTGLLNLLRDCEKKKIDFIVTKSISRFARNTKDCLEIVRRLTELGIAVLFEKENINTGTMDSELILTILSSLAAEESVSISQNSKWGIKRRFLNGTYKLALPPYGYNYNGETLIPNPEQALIVKRIFAEVLAGSGTDTVAKGLNADGIVSKRGGKWSSTVILGILENERYIGDVVFQKTYTDDSFTRHTNRGKEEKYYWKDCHEAIISREDFEAVAIIIGQRRKEKGLQKGTGKYSGRYIFSGIITCSECGSKYKRQVHMPGKASEYIAWCCGKHIASKSRDCSMIYIRDAHIKTAFVTMMNRLYGGRDIILCALIDSLNERDNTGRRADLSEIERLMQENMEQVQMLTGLMSKGYLEPALFIERNNVLQTETAKLREQKTLIEIGSGDGEATAYEAVELLKHLNRNGITEVFSDDVFKRFVTGITVFSPTEVGFDLKCGLCLRERTVR